MVGSSPSCTSWMLVLLWLLLASTTPPPLDAAAAEMIKDIRPGSESSRPSEFQLLNGKVYFAADNGVDGDELWVTDGTPEGTTMLKDIYPNRWGARIDDLTVMGGKLYFRADNGQQGTELWVTNGTPNGTQLLKDIYPGRASSSPADFELLGTDRLLFRARNQTIGDELFLTDGTEEGTILLRDINPGVNSSDPQRVALLASGDDQTQTSSFVAVFAAKTETHGRELYVTDGTHNGTVMLKDINPGPADSLNVRGWRFSSQIAGSKRFFAADDGTHGVELWVTDGTTDGTQMVKDIFPGPQSSFPTTFSQVFRLAKDKNKEVIFFEANDGTTGASEPWMTDGTKEGTVLLKDIHPRPEKGSLKPPSAFVVFENRNRLLIFANDGTHGREVWESDGTADGTKLLVQLQDGPAGMGNPTSAVFLGEDDDNPDNDVFVWSVDVMGTGETIQLWKSDATRSGTRLVHEFRTTNPIPGGDVGGLRALNSTMAIFRGFSDEHGAELWRIDITATSAAAGTTTRKGRPLWWWWFTLSICVMGTTLP